MAQKLAHLLAVLLFLFVALPGQALSDSEYMPFKINTLTDDPDHSGYFNSMGQLHSARWQDIKATCNACRDMAKAYNETMRALFALRYRIAEIERKMEKSRETDDELKKYMTKERAREGIDMAHERAVAELVNYRETAHALNEQIPALQAQERELTSAASALRQQFQNCEQTMCRKSGEAAPAVAVGGNSASAASPSSALPFAWSGPYPDVCHKCARLAQRLNELPGLYRNVKATLERAKAQKIMAENEILRIRSSDTSTPDGTGTETTNQFARFDKARHQQAVESLENAEKERDAAQELITAAERDIEEIKRNFDQTLKLYNDCVPTCQQQGQRQQGLVPGNNGAACPKPPATAPISVGKASEVGSAGKTASDIKNKAIGMAIGGLMGGGGGGGFGFGGTGNSRMDAMVPGAAGSGTAKAQPKTDKDPVKKRVTATAPGGTKLAVGAIVKDGKLIVSSAIKDSPGKGTFQAVFLENAQGQRMEPVAYYIYELWLNWTLNVWWTHDRYVDGQHVLHESGEWSEHGREKVGTFPAFQKGKGKENAIWNRLGFSHATEGVQTLGAAFPVDLKKSGPVSVVVHTTLPRQDPVMTDPLIFTLSDDGKGGVTVENAAATVACP